jgi:hypothetical protein
MKVENKQYCDISKFSIREINKNIAKDIIVNNHYSGIWTKVSYAIDYFTYPMMSIIFLVV